MKLTIEELRKVYEDDRGIGKDAALIALARFVAKRQRAVEPTEEMIRIGYESVSLGGGYLYAYRAMQSVAPLVVPE